LPGIFIFFFSGVRFPNFRSRTCWQHNPDARPDASLCVDYIKSLKEDNPEAGRVAIEQSLKAPSLLPGGAAPAAALASSALEPTQVITSTILFDDPPSTALSSAPPPSPPPPSGKPLVDATVAFTAALDDTKPPAPTIFDDEESSDPTLSDASVSAPASSSGKGKAKGGKDSRPICWYDRDCYRKNRDHFLEYSHPEKGTLEGRGKREGGEEEGGGRGWRREGGREEGGRREKRRGRRGGRRKTKFPKKSTKPS
jgi:hypothetical protein